MGAVLTTLAQAHLSLDQTILALLVLVSSRDWTLVGVGMDEFRQ